MKKSARRFRIVCAICAATTALFLALLWHGHEYVPLQKLEFFTQDMRAEFGVKTPG